jgi:hypothetical protein
MVVCWSAGENRRKPCSSHPGLRRKKCSRLSYGSAHLICLGNKIYRFIKRQAWPPHCASTRSTSCEEKTWNKTSKHSFMAHSLCRHKWNYCSSYSCQCSRLSIIKADSDVPCVECGTFSVVRHLQHFTWRWVMKPANPTGCLCLHNCTLHFLHTSESYKERLCFAYVDT